MSARLAPGGLFKKNSRLPVAASAYWSMATMIALDVLHRVDIGISLGWSSTDDRRQFKRLMKDLLPGHTVVLTKLDRLARSSRDLDNILHELQQLGVTPRLRSASF